MFFILIMISRKFSFHLERLNNAQASSPCWLRAIILTYDTERQLHWGSPAQRAAARYFQVCHLFLLYIIPTCDSIILHLGRIESVGASDYRFSQLCPPGRFDCFSNDISSTYCWHMFEGIYPTINVSIDT